MWTEAPDSGKGRQRANVKRGGRWKVFMTRFIVWGALGIVMAAGIFSIIGPKAPNITKLTTQVLAAMGRADSFPAEAGEQQAAAFVTAYMNIDPGNAGTRLDALGKFFPENSSGQYDVAALGNANTVQKIVAGPILASTPEAVDGTHVVYTFGVLVERPTDIDPQTKKPKPPFWLYLAVPMVADEDMGVAVAGAPALVPAPAVAKTVKEINLEPDADLVKDAQPQLENYLALWAASDQVGMQPYLQADSTSAARAGLGTSNVKFNSLRGLVVQKLDASANKGACEGPLFAAPCRKATATVVWGADGLQFTQTYRFIVYKDGDYWRVLDIRGGNYSGS